MNKDTDFTLTMERDEEGFLSHITVKAHGSAEILHFPSTDIKRCQRGAGDPELKGELRHNGELLKNCYLAVQALRGLGLRVDDSDIVAKSRSAPFYYGEPAARRPAVSITGQMVDAATKALGHEPGNAVMSAAIAAAKDSTKAVLTTAVAIYDWVQLEINGTPTTSRQSVQEKPKFSEFKVFSVSANHNSFGLRGVILMNREGEGWEIGMNDLNIETHGIRRGEVIKVRVDDSGPDWISLGAEIPHKLPKAPKGVIHIVWSKPVEEW